MGCGLLPGPSWAPRPFEGQCPAELAGWAGRHYGHDSAQAEVNKQHPVWWLQQWQSSALQVKASPSSGAREPAWLRAHPPP